MDEQASFVSIELIENEIRRFLASGELEVMCITGQWGVGKTYAWNKYLRAAQKKNQIGLKRYSYVSLFGIDSLDELKYSIFENSVQSTQIGIEPSIETFRSNTAAAAERLGRKWAWLLQQIPFVKSHTGSLSPMWYLSVKETIICIDDVERRGKNLAIRDVLGLTSSLKELKRCKVALILNAEAMQHEEKDFKTYFEKVVDISLTFAPSPKESVGIALSIESRIDKLIAEKCIALGISNIRLIKKIQYAAGKTEPMLKDFDEEIVKEAVHSLVLLMWSVYEPSRAPSLEYLCKKRGSIFGGKKETVPPEEVAWNSLLDVYGFSGMDELDYALLDGIRNGFFNPLLITRLGSEKNEKIKKGQLADAFMAAWELFHDSFANNQDQVLNAIYKAFLDNPKGISSTNLDGTVRLFKELGRPEEAAQMIAKYIESRGNDRRQLDLQKDSFASELKDPEVISAINTRYAELKDNRSVATILLDMAAKNSWSEDDITVLANATVEEYYKAFKEHEGAELRKIINASLQFDSIGNARPTWRAVSERAKEALRRIGQESEINARRVRKYGITTDNDGS